MKRYPSIHTLILLCLLATPVFADSTATTPAPRTNPRNWMDRHEGFVAQAQRGGIDLLFMGDSITDFWRRQGSNVWEKYYAPRHAANFGISGDRTEHVLWRIEHGELDGLHPKVVVLMIGTNNSNTNSPEDISAGIKLILNDIHTKCPESKVLLLAVFPRNRTNDTPEQIETNKQVNERIVKFADGETVRFLSINDKLVGPDGKVPKDIMPDYLHPGEKGYQIWADAMEPTLVEMLK
jgi:lysophospholipase L1-like esterase